MLKKIGPIFGRNLRALKVVVFLKLHKYLNNYNYNYQYGNLDRITVNVQADDQLEHVEFDSRRAWSIQVTQIPCGCSSSLNSNNNNRADPVPKAPSGCLQFYDGISGDFKSFNYDSMCCYR